MAATRAICGYCGQTATGFAMIGDTRYCHGSDKPTLDDLRKPRKPTCYELGQWQWGEHLRLLPWMDELVSEA